MFQNHCKSKQIVETIVHHSDLYDLLRLTIFGEMEHISLMNKLFRFCELDQVNN